MEGGRARARWQFYESFTRIIYIVLWDHIYCNVRSYQSCVRLWIAIWWKRKKKFFVTVCLLHSLLIHTHTNKNFLHILLFNKFDSHDVNVLILMQGYVDFGRFDKLNYFVTGSGKVDFVQVSCISTWTAFWETL